MNSFVSIFVVNFLIEPQLIRTLAGIFFFICDRDMGFSLLASVSPTVHGDFPIYLFLSVFRLLVYLVFFFLSCFFLSSGYGLGRTGSSGLGYG